MIEIRDLTYRYPDDTLAMEKISMDFSKGDIIGVIGENGAGKSTLFMNLLGLLQPTSGKILFQGKELRYDKKFLNKYRQEVNMVFQDPDKQIFFSRVYDDVAFALRNLGLEEWEIKKRVEESLKRTNILDFAEKPVHYLSYGQKKRVAIAGVLAMDCKLLLLDEPTSGLDPKMTREICELILELRDLGKKIILSSHDMNFIYAVCDYIYVLKDGKLAVEGSKQEVFLDERAIREAGLEQPWLVELSTQTGFPLFETPQELFRFIHQKKGDEPVL